MFININNTILECIIIYLFIIIQYKSNTLLPFIPEYNNQNVDNLSNEINNLNINPPENDQCELKDKEWSKKKKKKETISYGTFGTVIKAKNKKTNEIRAIKLFNKYNAYFDEEKIKKEINNSKKVENENSIKIYDQYNSKEEIAIVMELCDCNLFDKLKESKGFRVDEIKKILVQLNNTFRIMIDKKIIHRDIKLENILVKDGIFKLSDYGETKQLNTLYQMNKQTQAGTQMTMAPEIYESEDEEPLYNSKSDLWSLGIIIYQMYFNHFPYSVKIASTLMKKFESDKNQKELMKKSTGDKKLDNLIIKLLKYNPDERITWNEYFNHPFFK